MKEWFSEIGEANQVAIVISSIAAAFLLLLTVVCAGCEIEAARIQYGAHGEQVSKPLGGGSATATD